MMKYIILGIILNTALIISIFTSQDVSLQIKAPSATDAGSTVNVEIELHKASITGFARFQQELPYGVTASPVYPANMDFSFEDNTVKMIWLDLPGEELITIHYQIHIHERLKGNINLDGTFSYIENNQRKSAEASGVMLAVNPSPGMDERLIVDVSESGRSLLYPESPIDNTGNVIAIRQEPVPDDDLGFIINTLINKGDKNHFAKIEDRIPEGFMAIEMESQDGIFTFSDQKARIIWNNLPLESSFIVSYRLIPEKYTDAIPQLDGEFSFIHNNITTTREIVQKSVDIKSLTENEKELLIASVTSQTAGPLTVESPTLPSPAGERRPPVRPGLEISHPLEAESGVYYRVQLAAGHRPVDIENYFKRLNITADVRTEIHEGWIKYSTGSFYDYKTARDNRVNIWNTTPIDDAFVSAYNDGLRITVQEALVIANHQWYR